MKIEECSGQMASGNSNKNRNLNAPKSIYLWTTADVHKWLDRHCAELSPIYSKQFLQNDITGRVLIRLKANSLIKLGIIDANHRDTILREILKLRLKADFLDIRDLEKRVNFFLNSL